MEVIATKTTQAKVAIDAAQACLAENDLDGAARWLHHALSAEPQNPTALYNLGMTHYRQANHEQARAYFDAVRIMKPRLPEAHFFFAACSLMEQDHDAAETGYREALRLAPKVARHWHGLGTWNAVVQRLDAALTCFRKAQDLWPGYAWAQYSESIMLLQKGDWAAAWPLFEARHGIGVTAKPMPDRPRWDGRELDGDTILLRTEQGIGDMIHMSRYILAVQMRGGDVFVETRPELTRLFYYSFPGVQVVELGSDLPSTSWYETMFSLPLRFLTTADSEPWNGPYISSNAADALKWKYRLDGRIRPRIGLCWQGGKVAWPEPSGLAVDARRSLHPDQLDRLLAVEGVTWISLQVPAPDLDDMPPGVLDFAGQIGDMADTAALVHQCDLIITVDTSIVHLAGAMGKAVWLLNRFDTDWRWSIDPNPWYPTLRVFRQKDIGVWAPVIDQAAEALREWLAAVRPALCPVS